MRVGMERLALKCNRRESGLSIISLQKTEEGYLMETQGPRGIASGLSLPKASVNSPARRRWRIWLGVLSLAVGFALVSLASGNFLAIGSAHKRAVTSVVTGAVKSAVVNRAVRTTSSVADRSSDPSGPSSAAAAASCTELSAIEPSFNPT